MATVPLGCGSSEDTPGTSGSGSVGAGGSGVGTGGTSSTGGATSGGATGTGGATTGTGGTTGAGGSSGGAGGSSGASGSGGSGGWGGSSTAVNACNGAVTSLDLNPFGCELAWGTNGNEGDRAQFLQFITGWIGSEPQQGLTGTCYGCDLIESIGTAPAIPVLYAYIIGEAGHDAGLPDCNVGGPPNLCSGGAAMIKQNRAQIIEKYANYAQMIHETDQTKKVVWLLEGDFMQYVEPSQSDPLTLEELGELALDISCAIKTNHPNAVVAMNHITWNSDEETTMYWGVMPMEVLDLVWTTGVGNNDGFFSADTSASSYNGMSARYDFVSEHTDRKIFVDTSFGPSELDDSWSTASASEVNARIAEGVIAVNVTAPPGGDSAYQTRIDGLAPQLNGTCN